MVATVAAGTTAQYYIAQVKYYLAEREPDGRWMLAGSKLGIAASTTVARGDFERLHAALDPLGRSLIGNDGGHIEAVGGYDVTFSAPKSLSVLWGTADEALRSELETSQAAAVTAAVEFLDREVAFCRRGHGGAILEKVRLTAAAFQHGEARPAPHTDGTVFADPALHTHVVVLNLAERADGSIGRLDGRPFFHWKMAAGAVYHQALAAGLAQLGFGIDVTGSNGMFEVAGVDPNFCRYFSARREEIQDELAAIGLTTADAPALAAAKAQATRRSKAIDGEGDRHAQWRHRTSALGIEPEQLIEQAREIGRARLPLLSVGLLDEPQPARAVLAGLTERNSLFEHRHLVAALAAHRVGMSEIVWIDDELAKLRTEGAFVELGRDRWDHAIYSTPEVMQLEQNLYLRAARLAHAEVAAPSAKRVEHMLADAGLNEEQETAARLACSSSAIVTIEGAPGVGKTTLLRPVADAWADAGWRVIGASTAWKVAHQLKDELSIEARAIDSWLVGAEHGRPFLTDKTLLVIDESGLITSRQMEHILGEVERAREAGLTVAVRMVGDRRQLQPIGGPGLRIVAEAIGAQRVDTIVRQREVWARDVVTAFGEGRASDALNSLAKHGCIHEADGPSSAVAALVDYWDRWRDEHAIDTSLLIAKTNAQVAALNRAVRQRLRVAGELGATDVASVEAVTPSGQPVILDLTAGDRVRFLVRNDALGIVNGTEGRLERIDPTQGGIFRLQARIGDRIVAFTPNDLADEAGRTQITHAYATTCYGSQGLTTEAAFILADPAMDRHDIHVAVSRARETTHLFVDRRGLNARVRAARLLGDRDRQVEAKERGDVLSAALGRSGFKQTTLDYLTPAQRQALLDHSHEREWGGLGRAEERTQNRSIEQSPQLASELPAAHPPYEGLQSKGRARLRERSRSKGLSLE